MQHTSCSPDASVANCAKPAYPAPSPDYTIPSCTHSPSSKDNQHASEECADGDVSDDNEDCDCDCEDCEDCENCDCEESDGSGSDVNTGGSGEADDSDSEYEWCQVEDPEDVIDPNTPLDTLPRNLTPTAFNSPPVFHYGMPLTKSQIAKYIKKHNLSKPHWTARHHAVLVPFVVIAHLAETCNAPLMSYARTDCKGVSGLIALFNNYHRYDHVSGPEYVQIVVQRLQEALGVKRPAKWYCDYSQKRM